MLAIERQIVDDNWFALGSIFCLLALAILKFYRAVLLKEFSSAFFLQGFIEKRVEENPPLIAPFYLILFVFSAVVFSLTLTTSGLVFEPSSESFVTLFLCCFCYIFLRNIIDLILDKITIYNEETRYFRITKLDYLFTTAIWIFPVTIVYHYGFKNDNFLFFAVVFIAVIRMVLIVLNNKRLILKNISYFILYLCALELAPALILYKGLIDG